MKKLLLSMATLLVAGSAWAHDYVRITADDLNSLEQSKRIAIECTQESNYERYYDGNTHNKGPFSEAMVFEWVPAGEGKFYIKKAFAEENAAYLQNNDIKTFGPKDAANVAKFTAVCPTKDGSGVNNFGEANCHYITDEDKIYWVRLSIGEKWFNFNGSTYNTGTGVWTVQNILDLSDYYKVTINIVKDDTTTTETKILKVGEEITVPEYPLYDSDYTATTKTASDDQVITVTYTKAQTATVTYNYVFNEKTVATESFEVEIGSDYPEITEAFPYGITGSKPNGKVSADDAVEGVVTKEIALSKTAELPFKVYADYNSVERWYYLNIRDTDPTYLKYEEGVNYIKTTDNMASVEASEDKDAYTWAFIGDANDPFAGFQMVNYKTGATMVLSAPAAPNENKNADQLARMVTKEGATGNTAWVIKNTTHTNAASGAFYVEHPTEKAWAFNRQDYDHDADANTAAIRTLCYWNYRDTGSALQVVERDFTGRTELQALVDMVKAAQANYVVGTTVGYLTQASVDAVVSALASAEEALKGTMTEEISSQHQDAINAAIAALATVQPEEGKFYTIVSAMPETDTRSGKKIYISNDGGMYFENASTLAHVFQFVPASDGKYYLYGVERGTYLTTSKGHGGGQHEALTTDKAQAKAVKIANMGRENVVSITPESGAMIHAQEAMSKVVAWDNPESTSASAWKIVEVDIAALSHSVTITEAGWATLVLGCNATIPAGVKAYVVSSTTETSATLAEITGTIPANEAVLLNAAAGTYEFKYAAEATPVAENLLVGTVYDTNVESKAYVLSAQGEPVVVGFREAEFKVSTNTENDGAEGAEDDTFEAFKNNAFRAYLPAPAAGARFLSFDFGTETAIENIEGAENAADAVIYDLAGRRIQKAQKGLYIVNGAKVIK